jgi:dihydrofolate synthase/folylpolyglutamate synthase
MAVHPNPIDLGLDRLWCVLERLAWRQPAVPVITIAGTNGKGSVAAYCAAILAAAGYRVGMFTSPHLRDYRERIRIGERLVTEAELVWAFERIELARAGTSGERPRPCISLTFFEYNALAAFLILAASAVDAWVLEVGMGGRLDAVNAVDATVAVVVSIGMDHQEFLGSTLAAIAREKAGIFRRDRSAVVGSRSAPPVLTEVATAAGARLKRLGLEFDYTREPTRWRYHGRRQLTDLPPPALAGNIQFANAATAIAALEELEPRLSVPAAAVAAGLTAVQLAGRFQVIAAAPGNPTWILDVAHNADAAQVLRENLLAMPTAGRTLAVCGILADKDAPAIAAAVRDCFDAWWLVPTEGVRGSSAAALAGRIAHEVSAPLVITLSMAAACAAASAAAAAGDRIVVFGSFHTVGPALDWLDGQHSLPAAACREYPAGPRGG